MRSYRHWQRCIADLSRSRPRHPSIVVHACACVYQRLHLVSCLNSSNSLVTTPTGPLTTTVKRSLRIHNPNPSPIAFKVKTTAPKQYCVRPNSGRVEAGESVEVQGGLHHLHQSLAELTLTPVVLQALATEPPPHAKCKDKFLVQSAFISPDDEMLTLAEMVSLFAWQRTRGCRADKQWAQTEKKNKAAIQEQKLRCAYLPSQDGSTGANGIPEEPEDTTMDQSKLVDESVSGSVLTPYCAYGRVKMLVNENGGAHRVVACCAAPYARIPACA